ncbi:hypothetical protein JN531_017080 (plasmid) [Flagellatimonas centrodinii]|uniref:hypothetical protein n=1 Tax=Flagellatimonas centrodinii TaxID=2806210 RepID=UPI001FF88B9A|nr:hypothetical protein [Flagellatimonas centrodinii]ULQ48347.1 hypothetical protein JN531_017080 [Flagellatimonas centrodinii]
MSAHFLSDEVYPRIDVGDAGVLDALKAKRHQRYWSFDCPVCERPEKGFYYPGSGWLSCSHVKCDGMSLWEWVGRSHTSKADTFKALCALAGVQPPERPGDPAALSEAARLAGVTRELLRLALVENQEARTYLEKTRGYSPEIWPRLDLGYYPSARWLQAALEQRRCNIDLARRWGLLPDPASGYADSNMARRIVGAWTQEDGSIRLWGRSIRGEKPKYLYTEGTSKRRPYLFNRPGRNTSVLAEGPFDAHALQAIGIPGGAVGGAVVTRDQAGYMAAQGVTSVIYVLDGGDDTDIRIEKTTLALESVGIAAFFAWPRGNAKDVDEMRRAGDEAGIREAVEGAVNAGKWLGEKLLVGEIGTVEHYERVRQAMVVATHLTPYSSAAFMTATGGVIGHPRAQALRALAGLLDAGLSDDEAARLIGQRYSLDIDVRNRGV